MNLTIDPWIPVVWEDGKPDKVTLLDVFRQGDRIRDLAVRPHERIALMRLLICVAQAALDGPKGRDDWKTSRTRLPAAAADYLAKWKHAFELFGNGPRFLQVPNVAPTKTGPDAEPPLASKMDSALATGNVSTLFDNAGGSVRAFTPPQLALLLLTFQCFAPGGLLSECLWKTSRTKKAGNVAAPCLAGRMVHTFLTDRNSLLNSIRLNLLNREQLNGVQAWGAPVWERMPQGLEDEDAIANATRSYVGRLVPVSRAVRIADDGISMIWGCALDYPGFTDGWRDPMGTIYIRKFPKGEMERVQLAGDIRRALWRELHAVAVVRRADDNLLGGPFALRNMSEECSVDVIVGAMVHAPRKTTTILDTIESVLHIPAAMFADSGVRLYGAGVDFAESWSKRLNRAISACHRELHDELDKSEFRDRGNLVKQKAASHYWTAIEQLVPTLLSVVENPAPLRPEGATHDNWAATEWGRALANAARQAYELACPHETPRQLKAYSLGLSLLFKPDVDNADEPEAEEVET